jgi:hypothetical protein
VTASTLVSLVLALLKAAAAIYGWLHERELIQTGEDRQITAALLEMAARSKVLKEVDDRFATMTPEQVNRELQGDFRDD